MSVAICSKFLKQGLSVLKSNALTDAVCKTTRNTEAKKIVSKVTNGNSLFSPWDTGNWGRPFYGVFQKNTKFYDVVNNSGITTDYVTCYFDKNNKLSKFLIFNKKEKAISVYDNLGNLASKYTPEETKSLFEYKHDSGDIHKLLRFGKKVKNEAKTKTIIDIISDIFKKEKVLTAEKDMVVYRALDKNSLDKIKNLKEGDIFTDNSFTSVATKKFSVLPFLNFKNCRHILKLEIPKGTKYLNLDEFHNVVVAQSPENELLLNRFSKILIESKDGFFNTIKARLIN